MSETLKNVAVFSGTACGTADPADKPASACGSACGAADPKAPASACGAADPRLLLPLAALHAAPADPDKK